MKPSELQIMLSREWQELGQHVPLHFTSETRFVTGNLTRDAQLHRVAVEYGIELDVNPRFTIIEDYRVIDEQKFMMFVLRWS